MQRRRHQPARGDDHERGGDPARHQASGPMCQHYRHRNTCAQCQETAPAIGGERSGSERDRRRHPQSRALPDQQAGQCRKKKEIHGGCEGRGCLKERGGARCAHRTRLHQTPDSESYTERKSGSSRARLATPLHAAYGHERKHEEQRVVQSRRRIRSIDEQRTGEDERRIANDGKPEPTDCLPRCSARRGESHESRDGSGPRPHQAKAGSRACEHQRNKEKGG